MTSRTLARVMPLLAPVHILILSVVVIPSLYVIWLSFSQSSFGQAPEFVGLRNYLVTSDRSRLPRAPCGTPWSWWSSRCISSCCWVWGMALLFAAGLPLRRFLLVAVLAPYAVSEVVGGGDVALPVRPGCRAGHHGAEIAGPADPRLVVRAEPRDDPDRAAHDLAASALHLRHPLCGAAGDPHRSLRGGADRRRHAAGRRSAG